MLYEEVDYRREGRNAERFSENFKDTDWIKAPSINWSRSTSKVYTKRGFGKREASLNLSVVWFCLYVMIVTDRAAQVRRFNNISVVYYRRTGLKELASTKPVAKPKQGIARTGCCGAPFACRVRT